ncbi:MAG: leucine-rich repeat domain-containing protein [Holosporales bacterium]|jgi:hypothetical protein|nr:leucine-rich repeat domain-containing protein [Holosporales bacterium]
MAFYSAPVASVKFSRGSKLARIRRDAFCSSSIKSIAIPKSVISIWKHAFSAEDLFKVVFERAHY